MSKIGDYLHDWRISQGLSQEDAAEQLLCSSRAVWLWEHDRRIPSYGCIKMIHEVTGAEWEDLF